MSPAELSAWTAELLVAAGLPPSDAADVADIFTRASLRGLGHHDISFLPQRLGWLTEGGVKARPEMGLIGSGPAFERWEGDYGLGELLCRRAAERAIELCKKSGVSYVTVRHSNHFLAAEPYLELGVGAGCMLAVWSNTDACMTSPSGARNVIGNNPMGFGVEAGDSGAILLDQCMAYSSLGNLKALARAGQAVPEYWGFDAEGRPATDPAAILSGGVRPIGGHKGFNLAVMHECLTGILSGGDTLDELKPAGGVNGHNQAVLAFNLDSFGGRATVGDRVSSLIKRLKGKAPEARVPGEHSRSFKATALKDGIDVPAATVAALGEWSRRLGVQPRTT
jgi:LDH2 family malate/lactate/ureidoglycolate dehydrogenase